MGIKKIYVYGSHNKFFKWSPYDGSLWEDKDGSVGNAKTLEDAVSLAKSHAGGSNPRVELHDE